MDVTNSLEKIYLVKICIYTHIYIHHIEKKWTYYVARQNVLSNKKIKITVFRNMHLKIQVVSNYNKNLQQTIIWNAQQ